MIIDCAVYREGHRVELADHGRDLAVALRAAQRAKGFLWIGLHEPTDAEMGAVADTLGLHRLAVEDAVRAHQRPKLEPYPDGLQFMVVKTLWYVDEEDAVETGEIAVFVGPHFVVSVRHGEGAGLEGTRRRLEDNAEMLGHGPFAVLYAICDQVVDSYDEVAEALEVDVDEIELSVFSDARGNDSERIYTLKREVAEFRRALLPLREPLAQLSLGRFPGLDEHGAAFFRDVADHAIRIQEQVESLDALLSSAHDAHMARITVQQNDDMRKISAWVAIAAVPTAVAGIYGMKFDHMPELGWQYGYPLVLVVMLVSCCGLFALFKRSDWL
ncbi:MAG: magnesium/cobalt transporter CorA [Nocardioidaceae bacterium]